MVGMSNGLNEGDTMLNGNQNHIEQQHKKDWLKLTNPNPEVSCEGNPYL
jgi:hypothetical protein